MNNPLALSAPAPALLSGTQAIFYIPAQNYPVIRNDEIMVKPSATYVISRSASLQGFYWFQRLTPTDWRYQALPQQSELYSHQRDSAQLPGACGRCLFQLDVLVDIYRIGRTTSGPLIFKQAECISACASGLAAAGLNSFVLLCICC